MNTQDLEQLRRIKFSVRRHCLVCQARLGKPLIDLPDFPLTEIYTRKPVKERLGFVDQSFFICGHCGHGQINHIVDPKVLYAHTYFFRTSTSPSAREATDRFLQFIQRTIKNKSFKTIVEVGCNDLYLLHLLKNRARHLVGIDPVLADYRGPVDPKIKVVVDFIEHVDLAQAIGPSPDVVISSHVLEHIADPVDSIRKLLKYAGPDTLFFFQFPGLESLVGDFRFDQIFHQHISYFTLPSVKYMLNGLDCDLVDAKVNPYHWGALMIAFRKKKSKMKASQVKAKAGKAIGMLDPAHVAGRYKMFVHTMALVNERLQSLKNEKVYGYGAALMLPVLSYHLKNDLSSLECIVDDDPNKAVLSYVNLPVKICSSQKVNVGGATVLITATTALSNVRNILPKVIALKPKQIIVPLNIF